jgi:predicted MFS family arabinose efflux permease
VGLASVGGTVGADAARRLGARTAFALAAVAEAAALLLLGAGPGTLATGLASAVLFGAAYNTIVALQVIWSAQVFAARPSAGLAALLVLHGVGLLAGAPLFGAVAERTGLAAVFVAGAALLVCTAGFAPRERLAEAPGGRRRPLAAGSPRSAPEA